MAETYSNSVLEHKSPQYAYALVILSGGVAFMASQQGNIVEAWLYYALIAALFSSIWPYKSWQWPIWLCLPIILLIFIDVLSRGSLNALRFNGMILAQAFPSSCVGAYIGTKLSVRKIASRFSYRQSNKQRLNNTGRGTHGVKTAQPSSLKPLSAGRKANTNVQAIAPATAGKDQLNAALIKAAQEGDADRIRQLVADGADLNSASDALWTPLLMASLGGDAETLRYLFEKGASVDHQNGKGCTALMIAAIEGHKEIVSALLNQGAHVDAKNQGGWTALRFAVSMDETEILRMLLTAGADVNTVDDKGETPLMQAARENIEASLKVLLEAGADPCIKNHKGETALGFARRAGHAKIIRLLKEAEARASCGADAADYNTRLYLLKEELEDALSLQNGAKHSDDLAARVLSALETVQERIDTAEKEGARLPSELSHKLTLTLKEAAILSGLSRQHLTQAIEAGRLQARLLDQAWRIKRADLDNYVRHLS